MKQLRLLTLALYVLCLLGTCAPAETETTLDLGDGPVLWSADTAYVEVEQGPALLIGFDLYQDTLDGAQLRQVVEQLQANRGNYLRINTEGTDTPTLIKELARAIRFGILVDTSATGTWAKTVRSPRHFQASLLAGEGRLALEEFTQAGLNAIRAARTVERHIPFWRISGDTRILSADNPTGASGGTDGEGNYLIYIPTAGRVNLKLDDGNRGPRRVTVVGYLGTQRSEVLRPPYDSNFTLLSNDPNGGWMIVELLEDSTE